MNLKKIIYTIMSKNKKEDKVAEKATEKETVKTEEQVEQSQKEVKSEEKDMTEQLKEEVAKEKEKFLRLFAEFENYKKRTSRERIELFKTANEEVMVALLPVLDDFDRGLNEMKKAEDDELLKGMELIKNKLFATLSQKGLVAVETKKGDAFDVEQHEAITQIPAPSDDMKGKIIDIIEVGYKLGDKMIRYPKVVVGQ